MCRQNKESSNKVKTARLLYNYFLSRDPFFLVFYVTSRCNARCKMCYNWDNISNSKNRNELSIDEIDRITRHIKSVQQLTISGGEPFLRDELAEICTLFNKNSKVQFITIPTNGLLTERIENILTHALEKNSSVHFRIGLSTPEIGIELDKIYEVINSFEKHKATLNVLQRLKRKYRNISIDAGIVCNKYNLESVKRICDYVINNMDNSNPIVAMVRGKPRIPDSKDVPVDELEQIYKYCKSSIPKINNRAYGDCINLMEDMVHQITVDTIRKRKMMVPCMCGRELVVIYDNGDVYPCEILNDMLGNIRDCNYNIHRIMQLNSSRKIINKIRDTKCFCTWECALNNNIIFSNKFMIELFYRYALLKVKGIFNNRYTTPR